MMTRTKSVGTRALAIATLATSGIPLTGTTGAATETVVVQSKGARSPMTTALPTAMTSPRSKNIGR